MTHSDCKKILNANTIKLYFSLRPCKNKRPCRFRLLLPDNSVCSVSGYPFLLCIPSVYLFADELTIRALFLVSLPLRLQSSTLHYRLVLQSFKLSSDIKFLNLVFESIVFIELRRSKFK